VKRRNHKAASPVEIAEAVRVQRLMKRAAGRMRDLADLEDLEATGA
jgi:hypothetical protein